MKVIIAGSRDFNDYGFAKAKLDHLFQSKTPSHIISGTARGADRIGERYATEYGIEIIKMPADWDAYGKRAGYIRNKAMLDIADAVVCFWDGVSPGTKHMIDLTTESGKPLRVVRFEK